MRDYAKTRGMKKIWPVGGTSLKEVSSISHVPDIMLDNVRIIPIHVYSLHKIGIVSISQMKNWNPELMQ